MSNLDKKPLRIINSYSEWNKFFPYMTEIALLDRIYMLAQHVGINLSLESRSRELFHYYGVWQKEERERSQNQKIQNELNKKM